MGEPSGEVREGIPRTVKSRSQCFSNINKRTNPLGIVLKGWFRGSRTGAGHDSAFLTQVMLLVQGTHFEELTVAWEDTC